MGNKLLYATIVLLLIIVTITPIHGNTVKPLYNSTRKSIPNNLPWYPIIVFGDNRPESTSSSKPPSIFYRFVDEASIINPYAVIGTGDHVGMGYRDQYVELYKVFNRSGLENIWLAIGNHDVDVNEGWNNWKKYIGPEYYYIDDIPGWRIGVVDSETKLSINWRNQLEDIYRDIGNRSLILVFHRPAYPRVNHNLDSERTSILLNVFKNHKYPKLVLQGHWHGWGYQVKYNVTWIITGGAGAPLYRYSVEKPENGEIVTGVYHYTILMLYPNQTFRFYPVRIDRGSITVTKVNDTAYMVMNTKVDVKNHPVEMPLRMKYMFKNHEVHVSMIVPAGSKIIINFKELKNTLVITSNTSVWYTYIYLGDNEAPQLYMPINNTVSIKIEEETTSKTSTTTSTSTLLNTSTISTGINTSIQKTISNTSKAKTTTSKAELGQYTLLAIIFIAIIFVVGSITWYYVRR